MIVPRHQDEGIVPFMIQPLHARQATLLEATSDLIRASELRQLGRMVFDRISSPFGANICFNYRLDPVGRRNRLVFGCGLAREHLESAQSRELGLEYCGIVAASHQPIVADRQRIACDPNGLRARPRCHGLCVPSAHSSQRSPARYVRSCVGDAGKLH
jgi:hypothetical protein